jgi:hypothetical protein
MQIKDGMKAITTQFSFYRAPISNIIPQGTYTLLDIYKIITTEYANNTELLRFIAEPAQARTFKATKFDYVTFSGVFSKRNDKELINHSGLLCLDFDHVPNLQHLKKLLLTDPYFETELLFTSPSGDGLKWIIPINIHQVTHAQYFIAVSNYLKHNYLIEPDKSGKDISRACFLCHDPEAYIHPKYLKPEV